MIEGKSCELKAAKTGRPRATSNDRAIKEASKSIYESSFDKNSSRLGNYLSKQNGRMRNMMRYS